MTQNHSDKRVKTYQIRSSAVSTGFFSPGASQFTFNRGLESVANPATITSGGPLTGEQTFNPK